MDPLMETTAGNDSTAGSISLEKSHAPMISEECRRLVKAKQVQLVYQQLPGVAIVSAICASLLVFTMWEQVEKQILLAWFGLFLLTGSFGSVAMWWWFQRANTVELLPDVWGRRFTIFGFFTGLSWGIAGYVCFPSGTVDYKLMLYVAMVLPPTIAMAITMSYKPAFFAIMIPMLVPIALRLTLEMDRLNFALSILEIVFAAGLTAFYINAHRSTVGSIQLRFENLDLVKVLTRKTLEAERANMAKTRFLAAASHDLRQPLHAQVLFLAELKARLPDWEHRNILEYLEASTHSLRQMLNSLLDVSRLDAGVVKPVMGVFPVGQLLRRLQCELEPQMRERGNRFRVVETKYFARSDSALLERILRNLLSNSLRYTTNGSVLLGCRKRQQRLILEVRDSGIGIPAEYLDSIFEEFCQLNNPERDREKGLGLGLAIVGRLAKLLQHPVRVVSRPGHGTVVTLDIPLSEPFTLPIAVEAGRKKEYSLFAGMMVLVIDDDTLVRNGMMRLLQSWGCESLAVASAQEALTQLQSRNYRPHYILADYRLHNGATGVDAIECVQDSLPNRVPAILITGDTAPERLREAEASGYPLLHKPIEPAQLYALLDASQGLGV